MEANCREQLETILQRYNYQLTDEQKEQFRTEAEASINELVNSYNEYINQNKITSFNNNGGLDVDPYTYNSRTYFTNGRQNTVFSDYLGTNNSYSMADMVASITIQTPEGFVSTVLGELQTITYSIYQQKAPVRILGNINAKDWVMGPRTIAGSLVFAVFNKHWLMNIYDKLKEKGMKNWHYIADEIPPFDVTISFANEYGYDSRMALYGVRLLNEGQSMATNDIYIENTYQFVASDIELMDSLIAYQSGASRHRYTLISANDTTTNTPESFDPNPIDRNPESNNNENTNTEIDISNMVISEEELSNMSREDAIAELKERYEKLDSNLSNEQHDELTYKYVEEYNKINKYYKNKEAEKVEK